MKVKVMRLFESPSLMERVLAGVIVATAKIKLIIILAVRKDFCVHLGCSQPSHARHEHPSHFRSGELLLHKIGGGLQSGEKTLT